MNGSMHARTTGCMQGARLSQHRAGCVMWKGLVLLPIANFRKTVPSLHVHWGALCASILCNTACTNWCVQSL